MKKIWIFIDENKKEHEFVDPYDMMEYMWLHYIEHNVIIGWRDEK